MPKAVRLTCVRHAETKANRDGLLQGQLDIPLSDIGKEQATKLGKRIADLKFDYWFTSDLSRARETADIAASHNQAPPTEVHRNVLLRERSFGSLEGMPIKEFRQAAAKTKLPMSQFVPPNGESEEEMSQDGEGTEWEVTEEEVQGDEKKYHLHIDVHSFHDADHLANSPKSAIAL
ncbi:unnamed protein product [Cyprideis torosa]|uniref:Uncharacterized protein n=1 Tax=Cyprideis torosa TaxID=163714 RepID=A0A7R8W724_9CRUS|nr:unnamed protein product [Cyprideis torosa]CAG0887107.1 unnamed protein product [Cyprideis torosa]